VWRAFLEMIVRFPSPALSQMVSFVLVTEFAPMVPANVHQDGELLLATNEFLHHLMSALLSTSAPTKASVLMDNATASTTGLVNSACSMFTAQEIAVHTDSVSMDAASVLQASTVTIVRWL